MQVNLVSAPSYRHSLLTFGRMLSQYYKVNSLVHLYGQPLYAAICFQLRQGFDAISEIKLSLLSLKRFSIKPSN
jgi:hypothetical protein